jgi:hypothetical protein
MVTSNFTKLISRDAPLKYNQELLFLETENLAT